MEINHIVFKYMRDCQTQFESRNWFLTQLHIDDLDHSRAFATLIFMTIENPITDNQIINIGIMNDIFHYN